MVQGLNPDNSLSSKHQTSSETHPSYSVGVRGNYPKALAAALR